MIKFNNVTLEINDGRKKRNIVDDLTFSLPNSGLISILGKSGSGKSTILNLISLNLKCTSGTINTFGISYNKLDEKNSDYLRRNIISYVTQENNLFNNLTVKENIKLAIALSGKTFDLITDDYTKFSKMLGVQDLINENVSSLSGGEKQRINILVAILRNTKIYLCDEPTSSLDYENSIIILDVLKELSKDKLVIVSTHDVDLIQKYTNDFIQLSYGKIINTTIKTKENKETSNYIEKESKVYMKGLGTSILKKQKFRLILTTIILFLSMLLSLVTLSNLMYEDYSFTYDSYSGSGCDIMIIANNDQLEHNTINKDSNYFEFETNDFYYHCNILNMNEHDDDNPNETLINNLLIDNNLEDNEILITDYMNEIIKSDTINFKGTVFKVSGVEETSYKWYNGLTEDEKAEYSNLLDLWYKTAKVNEKTFKTIKNIKMNYIEAENAEFLAQSSLSIESLIEGSSTLDNNEILINLNTFKTIYHVEYNANENPDFIGDEIPIKINGSSRYYTIKGLVNDNTEDKIYFPENIYNNILTVNDIIKYPLINVVLTDEASFISILKVIDSEHLLIASPFTRSLMSIQTERNTLKGLSKYIFTISLFLFITLNMFLNTSLIKANQRGFGILRNYGASRKQISIMLLIDGLKTYIPSMILSVIGYCVYISLNNRTYIRYSAFSNKLLHFSVPVFILFVFIYVVFELITLLINLHLLNKKNNKDLLSKY